MKITVKASGSSNGRTWVVPSDLPLDEGLKLAPIADLSDFANVVKGDGSVPAAPAQGAVLDVAEIRLRRYHRREGEGEAAVYSPTPSFALVFVLA